MVRYLTKEVFDAIHRMPVFGCMLVVVGNRERLEELCEQHGVEASTVTTIVTSRQADEPSEWADETSAKIMAYLGRNAVIGIPEFFAMCKRIEKIVVARRNTVREKSLMAYGNAIVPQVMREIMQACLVTIRQKK